MGKYSRSGFGFDRVMRPTVLAMAAAALAACATAPTPPPAAEPEAAPPPPVVSAPVAPRPAPRPKVATRQDAPLVYVVKPGDTLWGIANRFLLDPWQWPEVWINNEQVRNPHKIYPGDVLKLVYVDGQPRLTTGDETESGGLERLSPQVRPEPLEGSIPMIPIEVIRDFLRGPRLVSSEELGASPYVLAFEDGRLAAGAGSDVYIQNLKAEEKTYRYSVVRKGEAYRDPEDNSLLGYEGLPVGELEVREYGKPSSAVLSRTSREALAGDRLLPTEQEAFSQNFFPHPPPSAVGGRIISVFDGFSQIGQYQIITLNRGSNHGLEPGHVLDILQSGQRADDPYSTARVTLPDVYAGRALVFKVAPRASFALVMSAVRSIHKLDKVEKPAPGRS